MTAHEVLTALLELKQGRVTLTAEQQAEFLDAVEGLVRALIEALRGGDRMAAAMWYAHDRTPALARFADAARPQEPSAVTELETTPCRGAPPASEDAGRSRPMLSCTLRLCLRP